MKRWNDLANVMMVPAMLCAFGGCNRLVSPTETQTLAHGDSPLVVQVKFARDTLDSAGDIDATLRLDNVSKDEQRFAIMTCDWRTSWKSDNGNVGFMATACSMNERYTVELPPRKSLEWKVTLVVDAPAGLIPFKFRMGFTPLDSKETTWSEPVEVRMKW